MRLENKNKTLRRLIAVCMAGMLLLTACRLITIDIQVMGITTTVEQLPPTLSTVDASHEALQPLAVTPANPGFITTFGSLTFSVPPDVADGATVSEIPRNENEDAAWWQKTPGHLEVSLEDYYVLQERFHQPKIYVYPAQGYAELVPPAFESIHRLNNILGDPSASISAEQLPGVPFFNARAVFASNIEILSFQNGTGVRFLTQYAQSNVPVNNHELCYQFQGVTGDGAYYIIAIFPVSYLLLAETSDSTIAVPSDGIVHPDINNVNADWAGYFMDITDLLNTAPASSFTPALDQLDALINSMIITAP